ncbi:hypothetical protein A3X38_16060 [Salmonella enterica subsp. enterica serovar Florida]|uniref:Uncharacterized protein n=3 Tax=Salmonella enterica I TaxID=59201 RepID=A0A5U8JDX3_SALET|nr:hypothetical protein [Salmonella enterica]EBR7996285.1 hypothetical protein [Salmonella enterica subsp. enterica serovar Panama]EBS4088570.1 hypothetical protein [Salmonella enterica subsp. enterica serovar Newport]EBW8394253.1 hypothetical protein [Salmonella enterica subsp. enterica serovar Florida]ASD87162.1 hypothetical protein LFZ16_13410 [Salmonella enterica subsp. enterica serovar India str. SA20085604]EBR8435964.1 hypothetical protein [Salmonella enterica subsp. enterica serovar Pan
MGKGGGGSGEIKETSQQRAQAEIARKQWDLYNQRLKPMENIFMAKVDKLNDEDKYQNLAGVTNLGYQKQFGDVRHQAANQLTAAGIDPGSGKFQETMNDISGEQAIGQTDATNRVQSSQADKYIAGLQDVVALGAGQKADALQGYNSLAENSLRKAGMDAQAAYMRRQGNASLVGAGLGALGGYAMNRLGSGGNLTPKTAGTGANAIQNYGNGFNF